jgi:hypothetical protein
METILNDLRNINKAIKTKAIKTKAIKTLETSKRHLRDICLISWLSENSNRIIWRQLGLSLLVYSLTSLIRYNGYNTFLIGSKLKLRFS